MGQWNPDTYLRFGAERTRPSFELMSRVPLASPSLVYDLGCGPGNSTAVLRERWPDARIVGVDSSPEMIERARASGIVADWLEADVARWRPDGAPDVIYSNATLQWLPDHATLLPRLIGYLGNGGALAVQMPRNFASPSHTIIRRVVENGPWADRLVPLRDFEPVARPEDYYALLASGAGSVDIWESEYLHVLTGEDAVYTWSKGTALSPYLAVLAGAERERFIAECKARLAATYRPRANGVTLFSFRRLFFVAVKGV